MHRIKLITTDKSFKTWRSAKRKLKTVRDELNTMENADFDIEVEYRDIIPAVFEGKITAEWFDSISHQEYANGFDFVALHMGDMQRRSWGIKPTLRGLFQNDLDAVSELYFWADENTKRMRRSQFVETFLHELRHALRRGMGLEDDTHEKHEDGTIIGDFAGMDMEQYVPGRRNLDKQISILEQLVGYLRRALIPSPLYVAAIDFNGSDASPEDLVSDIVGCAESASRVIQSVLPDFPTITGTWTLYDRLRNDERFEEVAVPAAGVVIISPTGTARASVPGHVGIVGSEARVLSNNSYTGLWSYTHTIQKWLAYYKEEHGYPVYYYKLK